MARDGKTLVASYGSGVGLLDPITFKKIYWENTLGSNYLSLNFNEKQNKFVISGTSGFIKVYDVNSKSLFKEFKPSDVRIKNAKLTEDGKYIVYSYIIEKTKPYELHNYLKMIDLEGKIIKDFGETSSTQFTLTNDGKTLIYFMSDAIHIFDLTTLNELEGIKLSNADPKNIEMSNNGNFMLLGFADGLNIANSLIYCDLKNKNYLILNDNTSWSDYKLIKRQFKFW